VTALKLISVNVGLPRAVNWNDQTVMTGIFKEPVGGPVMLRTLNLDGDRQADLSVHGGVSKAVYAYPAEHYEYWKRELPDMQLPYGMFGENFSTEGLAEDTVNVGDRFRVGESELMVTEPRMPCYKLGIKFGRADILKKFLASRRTGFYFAVLKEGRVKAGDSMELLSKDTNKIAVAEITRLYAFEKNDVEMLQRVVKLEALSESWRDYFQHQLEKLTH
jgi:MOSC domain-containing protein YiiM